MKIYECPNGHGSCDASAFDGGKPPSNCPVCAAELVPVEPDALPMPIQFPAEYAWPQQAVAMRYMMNHAYSRLQREAPGQLRNGFLQAFEDGTAIMYSDNADFTEKLAAVFEAEYGAAQQATETE